MLCHFPSPFSFMRVYSVPYNLHAIGEARRSLVIEFIRLWEIRQLPDIPLPAEQAASRSRWVVPRRDRTVGLRLFLRDLPIGVELRSVHLVRSRSPPPKRPRHDVRRARGPSRAAQNFVFTVFASRLVVLTFERAWFGLSFYSFLVFSFGKIHAKI